MDPNSDSLDVTPEMALVEALKDLRDKFPDDKHDIAGEPPDKILITMLWDKDDGLSLRHYNAGLNGLELIAICELQKMHFIKEITEGESEEE